MTAARSLWLCELCVCLCPVFYSRKVIGVHRRIELADRRLARIKIINCVRIDVAKQRMELWSDKGQTGERERVKEKGDMQSVSVSAKKSRGSTDDLIQYLVVPIHSRSDVLCLINNTRAVVGKQTYRNSWKLIVKGIYGLWLIRWAEGNGNAKIK